MTGGSKSQSSTASRETSPVRVQQLNNGNGPEPTHLTNGHQNSANNLHHNGVLGEALVAMNGHAPSTTDQSDDEYIDTIDDYETHSYHSDSTTAGPSATMNNHASRTKVRYQPHSSGQPHQGLLRGGATVEPSLEVDLRFHNVLSQLNLTVERINVDVQQVMMRMGAMERQLNELERAKSGGVAERRKQWPKWWPFKELSPAWVAFIVLWPFVVQRLMVGSSGRRK